MDNVCHSLLGAAMGRAGLARRTPLAMSTLVIANNLPDIDVAVFATDTLAMSFRRGWTHGLPAQLTLPIVLTLAMVAYDRLVRRAAPHNGVPYVHANARELLQLSYLGVFAHVFLDFLNSYGIRLLMPFSERWFYGDALFIVDPLMYAVLGAGWWWSGRRVERGHADATRPARIGLSLAALYIVVMLGSNMWARAEVRAGLARAGRPNDTRFMVTPVFGNPFRREVVIDVGDRYEKGHLWFDPFPHFRPAGFGMPTGMADPDIQPYLELPRAQAFLRWSRFPFVQVGAGSPPQVWLNDYRYANAGPYGWSAVKLQ
jgi:inner membrane protein